MIHKQTNNYKPDLDPENWTNRTMRESELTDHKTEDVKRRLNFWVNAQKKPDMREYEKKELELIRRISGATEGDDLTKRVEQRKKEFQAEAAIAKHYAERTSGQSEEGFREEISKWSGNYRKVADKARKDAGL